MVVLSAWRRGIGSAPFTVQPWRRAVGEDSWARPQKPLWVFTRADGCDVEIYAASKDEAIQGLLNFGILEIDPKKVKRG